MGSTLGVPHWGLHTPKLKNWMFWTGGSTSGWTANWGIHIGDQYNKTEENEIPYWELRIHIGTTFESSTFLSAPHWGLHIGDVYNKTQEINVPYRGLHIPMGSTLGGSTSLSTPHWGLHIGDFHNGTHWKRHSVSGAPHPYGLHIGGSPTLSAPHWGSTLGFHIGVPHWGLMDLYMQDNCKKKRIGGSILRESRQTDSTLKTLYDIGGLHKKQHWGP